MFKNKKIPLGRGKESEFMKEQYLQEQQLFGTEDTEENVVLQPDKCAYYWVQTRLVRESGPFYRARISGPEDVVEVITKNIDLQYCDREYFLALFLDRKGNLNAIETVCVGGTHTAIVEPKVLFKAALLASAESVILVHNHPSGDPTPSREDINLTETMRQAGKLLDIQVLDHIIIGHKQKYSLQAAGMI
jgi:DNA repair protein RadC